MKARKPPKFLHTVLELARLLDARLPDVDKITDAEYDHAYMAMWSDDDYAPAETLLARCK